MIANKLWSRKEMFIMTPLYAISRDERAHWKSEFGGVRWKDLLQHYLC